MRYALIFQVISERDILGTQLVRRNDELALLYEKIKIQQSTLNKGEVQYNQRLEDIRVLKLEIRKLRRERMLLQKSVANVDDLRLVKRLLYLPMLIQIKKTYITCKVNQIIIGWNRCIRIVYADNLASLEISIYFSIMKRTLLVPLMSTILMYNC